MTTQPPEDNLAAQAEALTAEIAGLRADVGNVRTDNQRLKGIVRVLVAVVALVVLLAVGLGFVAVDSRQTSKRAEEASSLAQRNAEYNRLSCQIGNESRAVQRQLWTYVLDVSTSGRPLNPTQRRQVMQFRAFVAKTFAPRDCSSSTPTALPPTSTPTR